MTAGQVAPLSGREGGRLLPTTAPRGDPRRRRRYRSAPPFTGFNGRP